MLTLSLEKYKYNYDKEADILYMSFGDPVPSVCDEQDDGVLVRYSLSTDEISGVTILDFSKRRMQNTVQDYIPLNVIDEISGLIG